MWRADKPKVTPWHWPWERGTLRPALPPLRVKWAETAVTSPSPKWSHRSAFLSDTRLWKRGKCRRRNFTVILPALWWHAWIISPDCPLTKASANWQGKQPAPKFRVARQAGEAERGTGMETGTQAAQLLYSTCSAKTPQTVFADTCYYFQKWSLGIWFHCLAFFPPHIFPFVFFSRLISFFLSTF